MKAENQSKFTLRKLGKEGLSEDYLKEYKKRYSCNGFYDNKINLQVEYREEISQKYLKENSFHRIF